MMTLVHKFDLDMIKMYQHTKIEVLYQGITNVIVRTDTQTEIDRRRYNMKHYLPAYAAGNELNLLIISYLI